MIFVRSRWENSIYIFFLITSLKLPTFYLSYSSQLVLCEQGVWGIGLYFPLPRRSHYCVMATVLANRPVPPISFPSYITASLSGIRELVWVQLRLLSLPLLMLIRQSFEQWVRSRRGQIGFVNQKCMITLTCRKLNSWWALWSDNGLFPVKAKHFQCSLRSDLVYKESMSLAKV